MKTHTLYFRGEDLDADESWRLVEWCMQHGADEFTVDGLASEGASSPIFDRFDRAASPHRRPTATREHLSAPTAEQFERLTDLWALNEETLQVVKTALPDGPFGCAPEDGAAWFEDLTVYREGKLVLGTVTHESEGVFRVTESEREDLDRLGLKYRLKAE